MTGRTGSNMMALLETRLDNVVYRSGLAATIWAARQLVSHGHVTVNGTVVNLPSYAVRVGDAIGLTEKMRKNVHVVEWSESSSNPPEYLLMDKSALTATLSRMPEQEDIPVQVNIQLVVEFYNRLT